jgi:hypothetical protein
LNNSPNFITNILLTAFNNIEMKKILPFLPFIALAILFASCQKDYNPGTNSSTPPPAVASAKVKSYTDSITSGNFGNSVTTFNLSYDASDRIVSIISAMDPGDKLLFSFPSGSHFTQDTYSGGSRIIHEDFFLNSKSFIDSTFQFNDTEDSSTEKYFYNAANQVITLKEYTYSTFSGTELDNITTYEYDNNGDLVKNSDLNSNIETYEYYQDLSYVTPISFGPVNAGTSKKNHLLKKNTLNSGNIFIAGATYSYVFDTKNRLQKETITITDGTVVVRTFTYF